MYDNIYEFNFSKLVNGVFESDNIIANDKDIQNNIVFILEDSSDLLNEFFTSEVIYNVQLNSVEYESVGDAIVKVFTAIKDFIVGVIEWIKDKIKALWEKIKSFFSREKSIADEIRKVNNEYFKKNINVMIDAIEKEIEKLNVAETQIDKMMSDMKELSDITSNIESNTFGSTQEDWKVETRSSSAINFLDVIDVEDTAAPTSSVKSIPLLEPENINKIIKELLSNMITENELDTLLETYKKTISFIQKIDIDEIESKMDEMEKNTKHEVSKWSQYVIEAKRELLKIDINKISDITVLNKYISKYSEMIKNIDTSLSKIGNNISDKERKVLMTTKNVYQKVINICNEDIKLRTKIAKSYTIVYNKLKSL